MTKTKTANEVIQEEIREATEQERARSGEGRDYFAARARALRDAARIIRTYPCETFKGDNQ